MRLTLAASAALILLSVACKKVGSAAQTAPGQAADGSSTSAGDSQTTGSADDTKTASNSSQPSSDPIGCTLTSDCTQSPPTLPAATGFRAVINKLFPPASARIAVHRGRDAFAVEGQDAPIIGKFAYVLVDPDTDVSGEDVDIYLSNGCDKGWTKVGTQKTSQDKEHGTFYGVEDTGGYVMTTLSKLGVTNLAAGRHHFLLVLTATNEMTDLYVNVLPAKSSLLVTDIDGTLTSSEYAAAAELANKQPDSQIGSPEMMQAWYKRGYNIFYLTARPAALMQKTRDWLTAKGFPPGIIHTTNLVAGAVGAAAAQFKVTELAQLKKDTGFVPTYAFGNMPSDVDAFGGAGIPAANSYYYKLDGDAKGGVIHSDYAKLVNVANAAPNLCQ